MKKELKNYASFLTFINFEMNNVITIEKLRQTDDRQIENSTRMYFKSFQ